MKFLVRVTSADSATTTAALLSEVPVSVSVWIAGRSVLALVIATLACI